MKNFLFILGFALIGFLTLAPITAYQARANAVPLPATSPFIPTSTASIGAPPVSFEVDASALQSGWWRRFVAWIDRQICRITVYRHDSNRDGVINSEDIPGYPYEVGYDDCNMIRAS